MWKRTTQWQSLGAKFHTDLQTKAYPCKASEADFTTVKLWPKPILSPHYNTRFHLQATRHILEKWKCKDSAWAINCNYTLPPCASWRVTVQTDLRLLQYASRAYVGPTELRVPVCNAPVPPTSTKGKLKPTSRHQKSSKRCGTCWRPRRCFRLPYC